MTTVKSHRFPVSIGWEHGRLTLAQAPGKPDLEIATPPEFKDGISGVWTPETCWSRRPRLATRSR